MTISISAVILAGGQAKRMGGADKGLQLLHGKPLFQHIYERLRTQVEQISINANRNHAEYSADGLMVFADRIAGFQGPLSGILTALERSETDFVLFVPCDCPFFHKICWKSSKVWSFFTVFLLLMLTMANASTRRFV